MIKYNILVKTTFTVQKNVRRFATPETDCRNAYLFYTNMASVFNPIYF